MATALTFTRNAPIGKLLGQALDAGVRFRFRKGAVHVASPPTNHELLAELRRRRAELLPLFRQGPGKAVSIGDARKLKHLAEDPHMR